MSAIDTLAGYTNASTQRVVAADSATEYAYRDLGEGDTPLVLLQHFRGNLDNWDPALVDALASARRVVTFDNAGVGGSTGTTPDTIEQMARDAIAFLAEIRSVASSGDTPVLVLSADEAIDIRRAMLAAGANDFVVKPVDKLEYQLRVRNLLELRASRIALSDRA